MRRIWQATSASHVGAIIALVTVIGLAAGRARSSAPDPDLSPFRVSVETVAARRDPKLGVVVLDATMRVVNRSDETRRFRVYSCSWYADWGLESPCLRWNGGVCYRNYHIPVTLKPGEVYEKKVAMHVKRGWADDELSFRVSFRPQPLPAVPEAEYPIYWSERIVMKLDCKNL